MVSCMIAAVNIVVLKGILAFFCAFLLIFGVLFLFSPGAIAKMNQWGNKMLFGPVQNIQHNAVLGILLLVLGIITVIVLIKI